MIPVGTMPGWTQKDNTPCSWYSALITRTTSRALALNLIRAQRKPDQMCSNAIKMDQVHAPFRKRYSDPFSRPPQYKQPPRPPYRPFMEFKSISSRSSAVVMSAASIRYTRMKGRRLRCRIHQQAAIMRLLYIVLEGIHLVVATSTRMTVEGMKL